MISQPGMSDAAKRKVTAIEAAHGVLAVVTSNMERAPASHLGRTRHDPRDFTLIPFGGAGGLHAVALARAPANSARAVAIFTRRPVGGWSIARRRG